MTPLAPFMPSCRTWFENTFAHPTPVQVEGWQRIAAGEHTLLLAPTGSGKTLAAFFYAIDCLMRLPSAADAGVRVLYISPLKALVHDIERNLRAPLIGCLRAAQQQNIPCRDVRVDIRTGDSSSADRRRQVRRPADILVTTPESLFLLLGSQAAATLASVQTLIIDEIHALAPSKRGAHLALSLERLGALCQRQQQRQPQRIGLSATVRPHHEAARFLAGRRPVAIVDQSGPANVQITIQVPVPDMECPPDVLATPSQGGGRPTLGKECPPDMLATPPHGGGGPILGKLATQAPLPLTTAPRDAGGMWAAICAQIIALIQAGRATLVFVNSRAVCERLAERLNALAQHTLVRAHHGSLSHQKRQEIEEALKEGTLKGIVATSSLELGIDMGALDLVILIASPGSVARGLQRVGRAGHAVGVKSRGVIFPKLRGDLLECTVVTERMRRGALEAIAVPQNPLDVLAQHVVAMCVMEPLTPQALWERVTQAYPYHTLSHSLLVAVLEMLSGTYPSDEFAELRPLLRWDRASDVLTARQGARLTAVLNAGTIPDRGTFGVFFGAEGPRVGELDEEMVHECRRGDTFVLGASTWRIEQITPQRVVVSAAPGEPGKMPFWRGDGPGRPFELGRALGAFVRRIGALPQDQAQAELTDKMGLDAFAANNLLSYISEQRAATGTLPTDRSITFERFRDELGDWRLCILSPFGARVHAPWAMALEHRFSERAGFAVHTLYSDDGIVLRLADNGTLPELHELIPDVAEVEEQIMAHLAHTPLFATHFRENAARALLLPRRRAQHRAPLWQQRLRSKALMAAAQRYPQFPIILETFRHCLKDIFDVPALQEILRGLQRREITIVEVETAAASPFARALSLAYVASYLYEKDAPLAERRAQALTLDRDLLRELLGEVELRELLDAATIEHVQAELQHTSAARQARNADEMHDLLRRLGDLSLDELSHRCVTDPQPWLTELLNQRRALSATVAHQKRFIAAEDAGRYRDALGFMPPGGLPERFVQTEEAPILQLTRRYARTHGPFETDELAQRLGLLPAQLVATLQQLEGTGDLVHAALRPGGTQLQWCDAQVLRRLKRDTLAKLRRAVAAVESHTLVRFIPQWHGLDAPRHGMQALQDCIMQLENLALPFSALCQAILPARVADFNVDMLDMLCASGSIVWVGHGSLGHADGRVRLLRRSQAATLLTPPAPYAGSGPLHVALLEYLGRRGACFTAELSQVDPATAFVDLERALWDLVWSGHITNDTLQPLRNLGRRRNPAAAGRQVRGATLAFGGRWSQVAELIDPTVLATQRAYAQATSLLERYGVVSREAAASDDLAGGFAAVYPIFKAMEEAGRIRRGYFVEGLSGLQFALNGAVERLRRCAQMQTDAFEGQVENGPTYTLCAVDPANPFGSLLPWPPSAEGLFAAAAQPEAPQAVKVNHRLRRVAGSWIALQGGQALLYLEANGQHLQTFAPMWHSPQSCSAALVALRRIALQRCGRSLNLRQIDGVPLLRHPKLGMLKEAGAQCTFDGIMIAPCA